MKLTFEVNGYVINIDETEDGMITVSASKDDEVVEEFTLDGDGDVEDFDDSESQELPDEEGQAQAQGQSMPQAQAQAQLGESKNLISFGAFLKRK